MGEGLHEIKSLTAKELYEQGSKSCHQYSQTTMKLRMFTQQVLLGYAVAVSVFLTRVVEDSSPIIRPTMIFAAAVLSVFGLVLWALNQHHSKAFQAIRDDSLILLEKSATPIKGPWQAHQEIRENQSFQSKLAWHSPFLSMIIISLISVIVVYSWF